jgi:uncharacterized OsmC-like protein
MSETLDVHAIWGGGYAAQVHARTHSLAVDEPEDAGGHDEGVMPTELLWAAMASCFCLAIGHVAGQRGIHLPDLRVDVRATRAGRALRYGEVEVVASSSLPDAELAALVERAERYCWVSNTLADPPAVVYRIESSPTEVP